MTDRSTPYWLRRLFGGKPRVLCACGVYGEPDMIAVLYEGQRYYTYTRKDDSHA